MNTVTLIKTDREGMKTLLHGTSWDTALMELYTSKLPCNTVYTVIDNTYNNIALIVYSESLQCSRRERIKLLNDARAQYELNIKNREFSPSVTVQPPKRVILSLCENVATALFLLCIFFLILGFYKNV